jgi:hypothetical protein
MEITTLADGLIFPDFSSHPANRNICPACISVIWAVPMQQLPNTFEKLPRGCLVTFKHFTEAFLYHFCNAKRLSNSLLEHFPAAIGKNLAISCHFPQSSFLKFLKI